MSSIVFYSESCQYSTALLKHLRSNQLEHLFKFFCVDWVESHDTLPDWLTCVPGLLIKDTHGNHTAELGLDNIMNVLQGEDDSQNSNMLSSMNDPEPAGISERNYTIMGDSFAGTVDLKSKKLIPVYVKRSKDADQSDLMRQCDRVMQSYSPATKGDSDMMQQHDRMMHPYQPAHDQPPQGPMPSYQPSQAGGTGNDMNGIMPTYQPSQDTPVYF